VTDVRSWVWAICEGSRLYAELRELPPRPADAPGCPECNGVGIWIEFQRLRQYPPAKLPASMRKFAEGAPVLCFHCGGLDWVYGGPVPARFSSAGGGTSPGIVPGGP
jgi:hypothetical protein